jgi:hypothetical protein
VTAAAGSPNAAAASLLTHATDTPPSSGPSLAPPPAGFSAAHSKSQVFDTTACDLFTGNALDYFLDVTRLSKSVYLDILT